LTGLTEWTGLKVEDGRASGQGNRGGFKPPIRLFLIKEIENPEIVALIVFSPLFAMGLWVLGFFKKSAGFTFWRN